MKPLITESATTEPTTAEPTLTELYGELKTLYRSEDFKDTFNGLNRRLNDHTRDLSERIKNGDPEARAEASAFLESLPAEPPVQHRGSAEGWHGPSIFNRGEDLLYNVTGTFDRTKATEILANPTVPSSEGPQPDADSDSVFGSITMNLDEAFAMLILNPAENALIYASLCLQYIL